MKVLLHKHKNAKTDSCGKIEIHQSTLSSALSTAGTSMLFSVRGGRKSKQIWGYFPSATDGKKEHADAIFRPCGWKSMCSKHYFPSPGMKD